MDDALKPGAVLANRYRIESLLGAGGMGQVYAASDISLGRPVAIKVLPPELTHDSERVRRFIQEARAASSLNHPNILTIHEIGMTDGATAQPLHFIVSELVSGQTLRDRIVQTRRDLRKDLEVLAQVASGLGKAHAAGVVHRDIKPENLMVTADGNAKILDFGLAKLLDDQLKSVNASTDVRKPMTVEGVVMGTAAYLSPEQAQGHDVDHRSDIFSLGIVIYEVVARRRPFQASSTVDMIHALIHEDPKPLTELDPTLPFELQRIVRKCLAKDPDLRYQTANDLSVDLRALAREIDSAPRLSGPLAQAARPKRSSTRWIIIAVLAIAASTAILMLLRSGRGATSDALTLERITSKGNVVTAAISPDGKYVVYSSSVNGVATMSVIQLATHTEVQIFPPDNVVYGNVGFSRDGNYLWFARRNPSGPFQLYRRPVFGGSATRVFEAPIERGVFSVSPDERSVAYFDVSTDARGELRIGSLDDGKSRVVSRRSGAEHLRISTPAWSPDSVRLAFFAGSWDPYQHYSVSVVDTRAGGEERVTKSEWTGLSPGQVAWSADGREIVLVARDDDTSPAQLWIIDATSGKTRRTTHDLVNYSGITLTQDGHSAVSIQADVDANLWLMNLASGVVRQLTFDAQVVNGVWGVACAPDGRIIYSSSRPAKFDLRFIDRDGSNSGVFTDTGAGNIYPSVSPDGRRIAFSSERSGRWMLWMMNIDGTGARMFADAHYGKSPAWSPDGKWIVFNGNNDDARRVDVDRPDAASIPVSSGACVYPLFTLDGASVLCDVPDMGAQPSHVVLIPITGGAPRNLDIPAGMKRWTPDGRIAYRVRQNGVAKIRVRSFDKSDDRDLTRFDATDIDDFAFSSDGSELLLGRSTKRRDVVLVRNFQ